MKTLLSGKVRCWSGEPLKPEVAASIERLAAADDVVRMAIMPDVHLAVEVCVGVVLATTHTSSAR